MKSKANYYAYINWQAGDKDEILIHHWSCGHCRMGLGKHHDAKKGVNGVWLGPFIKRKEAKQFCTEYFAKFKVRSCDVCKSK